MALGSARAFLGSVMSTPIGVKVYRRRAAGERGGPSICCDHLVHSGPVRPAPEYNSRAYALSSGVLLGRKRTRGTASAPFEVALQSPFEAFLTKQGGAWRQLFLRFRWLSRC